jgi:ribosomal protein S18 acetylase RimI-like enzyme
VTALPAGYRVRDVDPTTDLEGVVALLRACDEHDVGFSDASTAWLADDWTSARGVTSIVAVTDDGAPAAYLAIESVDPSVQVEAYFPIAPAHRPALREAWTAAALERLQDVGGPGARRYVLVSPEEGAVGALTARGFSHVRTFWHMERAIDPTYRAAAPADDVHVRPYRNSDDDRLGWELVTASFEQHFGEVAWAWDMWVSDILGAATWDPSLVAIGERGEVPVGIVIAGANDGIGWIGDLGVLAHARGHGVGRALLEHAFDLLAQRGFTRIRLNVDSGNETGATHLYERAGMRVRRSFDLYEMPRGT